MKEKYFYILAYKHETDYKGLSHRQRDMANNGAISRRANQPGLADGAWLYTCQVLQGVSLATANP